MGDWNSGSDRMIGKPRKFNWRQHLLIGVAMPRVP
jgi:hypothetical protein